MLKDFFYLQRNDRQAIFVLLGTLIVCTTLVIVIGKASDNHEQTDSNHQVSQTVVGNQQATESKPLYYKVEGILHELFPFDPNTADSTQLLKLGLQEWQVRSIYRYRAKGGIFREPSDFARLYGLTKKQYEVMRPYIRISDEYRPASDFYGKEYSYNKRRQQGYNDNHSLSSPDSQDTKTYSYPQKLKPGQRISINTADTTELMKIPGIGSYYAKAIIRYREQLGGFVSNKQLLEIEGMPETALSFADIESDNIKKLSINKLTLNQLRRHPYINFYQAKEICDYRRLRGPIKSLQELKLLKDFPPDEIERLSPYIDF